MYDLDEVVDALATQFTNAFPAETPRQRTIGREAEYPVVKANGEAADARRLLEQLRTTAGLVAHYDTGNDRLIVGVDGEEYKYALEVGIGTIELNTRPCQTLFEVEMIMLQAVLPIVHLAARYGWRILGLWYSTRQPTNPRHYGTQAALSKSLSGHGGRVALVYGYRQRSVPHCDWATGTGIHAQLWQPDGPRVDCAVCEFTCLRRTTQPLW